MLPETDRNPLLPALLAFAAGAMAAATGWLPATAPLWPAAALIAVLSVLSLLSPPQARSWFLPLLLLPLFSLCGLLYTGSFLAPPLPPHHLARLVPEKQDASLTGTLIRKPVFKNGKTHLILETDSILLPSAQAPRATAGRVLLTLNAPLLKGLVPGRDYLVRARLSLPDKPSTPGVFDYAEYLAAEEILVKGWVATPLFIQPISPPAASSLPPPRYFLEGFRQQFEAFLHAHLAPDNAALYQALLLGDRSAISPEITEHYQAAGIMHLLAISGSHLVVVAFLATIFFRFLANRSPRLLLRLPAAKISLILSFPALFLYAGLAGFQPPVMRALLMTGVFMAAIILDRQWSSLNNLAIAAFCILLANPLSIHTASFQLSFAATAAIVLVMPRIAAWRPQKDNRTPWQRLRYFLISGLFISGAAFLATAPLALLHFNRISLTGPVTTLLVTPFLCFWTLPLGLLAILTESFAPAIALFFLQTGAIGIQISHALTGFLAGLPFSSFWLPTPTIPLLILSYALLFLIFRRRRTLPLLAMLACFALLLSGYARLPEAHDNLMQVSFLAVGNGSAAVVKQADRQVILIDGGGPPTGLFNVGERVIAPFLWHQQIRRVDQIILTHAHADHFNGLPWIIQRFQPKILWLSEASSQEPGFAALLLGAKEAGCQVRVAGAGEVLACGNAGLAITCLANLALTENTEPAAGNPNNRGLVLRLDHGENTFLFPGDIEKDYEEHILQKSNQLKAEVLLLPHHGLGSSGSPRFMEAVGPRYSVVSTGKKEPFPPVQYQDSGGDIFSTARHGTISFLSDGKKLTATPHRTANDSPRP